MKKFLIRYLPIVIIGLVLYQGNVMLQTHFGSKVIQASGVELLDLEAAKAKAASENKPVLVNVSAIWCPGCRQVDKRLLQDEAFITSLAEKAVFARLEYESDEGKAFAKAHGLRGFPNFVLIDQKGVLIKRLASPFSAAAILAAVGANKEFATK